MFSGIAVQSQGALWSLADSNDSEKAFEFKYYNNHYQFCQASHGVSSHYFSFL